MPRILTRDTITTCQINGNTDMFLWNKTTGALYLWTNLTHTPYDYDLGHTSYTLAATGWNTAATLTLQAADINGDGTPDVWTVGAGAAARAYLVTNLAGGSGTVTAQSPQTILAATHTWPLNDGTTGAATTAADTTGALTATGAGHATWHTGDLFSPDVALDGTAGTVLATSAPAVATNADFTVSVWAKPTTADGVMASEDGSHHSAFDLYADLTSGRWIFSMSTNESGVTNWDYAVAGTAQLGAWTRVTATYKQSTGTMAIYVNGQLGGTGHHSVTWNATGGFRIGDYQINDNHYANFNGQVAGVQVWNQTLTPTQIAALSNTSGYVIFPSDDTNYPSGSTWSTTCATMTFNAGLLSITMRCGRSGTVTYGTAGYPNAVLTPQIDGNMVIYKGASHDSSTSLWSSMSWGHPGDAFFLQPDGNLVAYDGDGTVLWSSGTNN